MPALIKVGISAWTDATLLASGWCPASARPPEVRVRFYASHVIMNNCYRDASVRNAAEMIELLEADGLPVSMPLSPAPQEAAPDASPRR